MCDKENNQIEPDISFNYLGQFDNTESSLFQLSPLGAASEISPDNELISQMSINAIVQNSKLTYSVTYNNNLYSEDSIHLLTEKMQFRINQLIDHCIGKEETILSPSDFTSDDISFDDLDDILSEIN